MQTVTITAGNHQGRTGVISTLPAPSGFFYVRLQQKERAGTVQSAQQIAECQHTGAISIAMIEEEFIKKQ